jgi:predicted peptidase
MVTPISLSILLCLPMNQDASQSKPTQKAETMEAQIPVRMQYLVSLPKGYDKEEKWPLVLFLHGAGERGDNLDRVKVHGPPKLIAKGKEFPFICVSPQCPKNRWWNPMELEALLDHVEKKYKVDADRVYLTGLSMGGFGTFALANHAPKRFAAIAPVCGGGDPIHALQISSIPTWVFHGAKDRVVPEQRSKEMVDALKKRKADVQYTVYPEAGHDSWTATYDNPKFYEWMLKQKRKSAK